MNRRSFAALALATLLVVASSATLHAAPAKIVRIWTEFRLAEDFVRLSEIVSGQERSGGAFIHRTHPGSRDGYYFTVRVDRARSHRAAPFSLRLSVIPPDSDQIKTFLFPIEPSKKRSVRLEVGLTGADWPFGDEHPLAWKIEVLDANGALVTEQKSFLWELPPGGKS